MTHVQQPPHAEREVGDQEGAHHRQQLAQAVGVARETVSLALTQLRHQNLLRTGRNQLFFDPEALRRFQGTRKAPLAVEALA